MVILNQLAFAQTKPFVKVDFSTDAFLATHVNARKFKNHDNKIEARY